MAWVVRRRFEVWIYRLESGFLRVRVTRTTMRTTRARRLCTRLYVRGRSSGAAAARALRQPHRGVLRGGHRVSIALDNMQVLTLECSFDVPRTFYRDNIYMYDLVLFFQPFAFDSRNSNACVRRECSFSHASCEDAMWLSSAAPGSRLPQSTRAERTSTQSQWKSSRAPRSGRRKMYSHVLSRLLVRISNLSNLNLNPSVVRFSVDNSRPIILKPPAARIGVKPLARRQRVTDESL